MTSGGGLTTLETAIRFPIRLVESGPAGGAILATEIAKECGLANVVSYDMGGTTAKICLIDDYAPLSARTFEVARVYRNLKGSGLPVRSEEHTSETPVTNAHLVCRLLLEKKNNN